MTLKPEERCVENVYRSGGAFSGGRCQRRGVLERKGKLFCKQHDPEAVKARRDAGRLAWDRKWEQDAQARRLADAESRAGRLLADLDDVTGLPPLLVACWNEIRDARAALFKLEEPVCELDPAPAATAL